MNQERVVKAGLLGLGTVGSGVYKLVERQKDEMALKAGAGLEIQKILVHNMNKKREGVDQSLLTDKWEDIMNDDEIEIVIEVMGGYRTCKNYDSGSTVCRKECRDGEQRSGSDTWTRTFGGGRRKWSGFLI